MPVPEDERGAADPVAGLAVHPVMLEVDGCARAIPLTRCFDDCRLARMPDVLVDRCGIECLCGLPTGGFTVIRPPDREPIQDVDISVRFESASPRQPEPQPEGTGQNHLRLVKTSRFAGAGWRPLAWARHAAGGPLMP
jgi:hypothetical protein